MQRQHYVLTRDPHSSDVVKWIFRHQLPYEPHLNRIRFWVPIDTPLYTAFALEFGHCCPIVEEGELNAD